MNNERDLIYGAHSILSCLQNELRSEFEFYACENIEDVALKDFIHKNKIEVKRMPKMEFHAKLEQFIKLQGGEFKRPPSGIALFCSKLPTEDISYVHNLILSGQLIKIICLDQVTDIHNIGAISRTACFYGVKVIVHSLKNGIPLTPTFYRISSGSAEHVKYIYVSSLNKFIDWLQEQQYPVVALSEDGKEELNKSALYGQSGFCLVLGSEDKGISHSVRRVIRNHYRLEAAGALKTLNVSVAAAVALDRLRD